MDYNEHVKLPNFKMGGTTAIELPNSTSLVTNGSGVNMSFVDAQESAA